jgi:hypothetical protein
MDAAFSGTCGEFATRGMDWIGRSQNWMEARIREVPISSAGARS